MRSEFFVVTVAQSVSMTDLGSQPTRWRLVVSGEGLMPLAVLVITHRHKGTP